MLTPRRAPRHRLHRLHRPVVLGTVVLAALGALAACSGSKAAPSPAVPAITQSVLPTPTPTPAPTSPFTGGPDIGTSTIAFKIDNTHSAFPHLGLSAADVVYIEQVEGGLTRIAAVFASDLPDVVAPVRSARETDAELLPTYGDIPVAFSGSVASVHSLVSRVGLVDVSEDKGGSGYYRLYGSGRFAPYNLAGVPKTLVKRGGTAVAPRSIGLTFGPLPAGGSAATTVSARFPMARVGFSYKPSTRRWRYTLDGRVDQVPGKAAQSASTVIIQYVRIGTVARGDKLGNSVPFTHTVGSGAGLVLRDGRAFKVTWSRASKSGPTRWLAGGKDFPMGAGQVWIVLANKNAPVKVR